MFDLEKYVNSILDFLFPKTCYFCKSGDRYICTNCRKNLNINLIQRCHVCGKETRLGFVHSECKDSSYLDGLIYVVLYDGKIKKLIKDVKYHFYYDILAEVSEIMADHISRYKFKDLIYTSVPLHWRRKNYRGFNQSELLAKKIAKLSGANYCEILKRRKNTKPQASLGREDRLNNLRDIFSPQQDFDFDNSLLGKTIILVDDVFTTGSTLNECAKALKKIGAQDVYGFCFAKSRQ